MSFNKNQYYVADVDKYVATGIVLKNHYLHRAPQNKYSFGLFKKESQELVGVCIFGIPASRALQVGICGNDYANEVIELTRLWVDDKLEKNAESFLVGNSIKQLKEKIIVSYAEKGVGHIGYIYQATNFIYTGLSEKRTDLIIDGGSNKHSRHSADMYGSQLKARELLGDRAKLVERPRKYRYVYFNCKGKERKELIKALKYKIQKYPKGAIEYHEKNATIHNAKVTVQFRLF